MSTTVEIVPGHEFECDRAKLTEFAVLVRVNGMWIELRPEWIELRSEQTMPTLYRVRRSVAAEAYERWRLVP